MPETKLWFSPISWRGKKTSNNVTCSHSSSCAEIRNETVSRNHVLRKIPAFIPFIYAIQNMFSNDSD